MWKQVIRSNLFSYLVIFLLGIIISKVYFPRVKTITSIIPSIITKHDTVSTPPAWLDDSIKAWKKKIYLTDTVNITHTVTLIDTSYIALASIGCDTSKLPNKWPVLEYHSHGNVGDTAFIQTFSMKTGQQAISKIFVPGYLTDLSVKDSQETPSLTFKPFPPKEKHTWFFPVKHFLFGAMAGITVYSIVK